MTKLNRQLSSQHGQAYMAILGTVLPCADTRIVSVASYIVCAARWLAMVMVALLFMVSMPGNAYGQTQTFLEDRTGYNEALPPDPGVSTLEDFSSLNSTQLMSKLSADPDQWNGFGIYASNNPGASRGSDFGPSGYCLALDESSPRSLANVQNNEVRCIGYNDSTPSIPGILISVSPDSARGGKVHFLPDEPIYSFAFDFIDWNDGTANFPNGILRSEFDFHLSDGDVITPPVVVNPVNAPPQFFGVILDEEDRAAGVFIEEIVWRGESFSSGEFVGIWNVQSNQLEGAIGLEKEHGTATLNPDGSYDVPLTLTLTNTGGLNLENLQLTDVLNDNGNFGPAYIPSTAGDSAGGIISGPTVSVVDSGSSLTPVAPTLNPNFDGGSVNSEIFTGSDGKLGLEDEVVVEMTIRLSNGASSQSLSNTANATAQDVLANDQSAQATAQLTLPELIECPLTDLSTSDAGYATSGDGEYKDSLLWLDWNCGTKNTFQPGDIIRKTWQYGPLEVRAELTDITAEIKPFDISVYGRLNNFYGIDNPLDAPIGLINTQQSQPYSYKINWETQLNGSLVENTIAIADAESTDGSENWRVTTDGDAWELLDVAEGVLQLEWSMNGQQLTAIQNSPTLDSFVVISDAVNNTTYTTTITGKQAAAYAVPFGRDFGDLPAAYANALPGHHLLRRIGDSGSKPTSPTTAMSIDLADFILDPTAPYLGAIEPVSRDEATPNASADAHEQDDGVQLPESLVPGSSVTIPVFVSGSGTLNAWIDWDGNGNFNGGDDQIAANVSGTDVINLTVTVPDDAQPGETFARFRWSSQSSLSPSAIAADGEVEDYRITILEPTTRISGRVFNDNGLNGDIAHDGEVNGDEAGLGGVAVKALDNSNGNCQPGDVLAETTTNGNGEWTLSLSVDDKNTPACLVAETPNGFRAISESDGTAGTNITLNALDDAQMTFTVPAPGTVWEGINFGKVGSPRLVPSQQGDVAPGNVIFYRHQFTAATAGEVTFSLANPTSTPDSPAWSQQVIRDPSCSGEADFSEPLTVSVEAEEQLCLLVRIFAPADAPAGAQHSVALTATQTLTLADNSTVTDSAAVTDITRVQTGQLGLEKRVRNIGVDGAVGGGDDGDNAFTTRNQGEPCDVLRYEIRYTNAGSTPIDDLEVNDATPAYTSLAAGIACPASFPDNLTGCEAKTPDGTNNAEGYQGSVAWQFNGQLAPGAQGTVSYDVRIEGAAGQCP